jgi:folate-binding protein YgfZ
VDRALEDRLASAGATLDPTSGRPIDYSDPAGELEAAETACALALRSGVGLTLATGPDVLDLLHRLTTADLAGLAEGEGKPAVITTAKGRIVQRVFVHHLGGGAGVLLVSGPGGGDKVRSHLERFTFQEQTGLSDVTGLWTPLAVLGPRAREAVSAARLPAPEAYRSATATLGEVEVHVLGQDGFSERGISVVVPGSDAAEVWGRLAEAVRNAGGRPAGDRAVEAWRVLQGLPENGAELTEEHNPLEAGLWDAVSFSKGCYVGQEVVARLKTYDKVSRDLRLLSFGEGVKPPEPGTPLYAGTRRVGEITTAMIPPGRSAVTALAFVKREHSGPGTSLGVGEDRRVNASVVELPFEGLP